MKKFKFIAATIFSSLLVVSCSNDDDSPTETPVETPATYSFSRNGESTVSFGGQTTRILMANQIISAFHDWDNASEESIMSMFQHQEGTNDFDSESLNSTSKNVYSKIAASKDFFESNTVLSSQLKGNFSSWIQEQTSQVFPNHMNEASAGTPGQLVLGSSTRYVNSKGIELNQLFTKGLIGGLIGDQVMNNYLSSSVLDAGSNKNDNNETTLVSGKNYTTMEHKWDEAYGYIYGGDVSNESNPNSSENTHNSYLHKYIKKVDSNENFSGISNDIFDAFKKGRAAIVAKNYTVREEQSEILREKISTVIAVRAIHYLQAGKDEIEAGSRTAGFHDLSEGLGFLYSLQFTRKPGTSAPYLNSTEVASLLQIIMAENGLWTVSASSLDTICETIASKFSFTVEQAK